MKDFAKSIRTTNAKKEDIIKDKKEQGVYLKVDNGQKLEFSDGTTYAKSTGSDDYREVHNYVGNRTVLNKSFDLNSSNSGELHLNDDGTGFMYDPINLYSYDIKGKSDALSAARELEGFKRETETRVKDCQRFIDALKQWANGLKTGNSKVGNGSGSWKGNSYEDSFGNSATVMKVGGGYAVFWEDDRGIGKQIGIYKDERTAKEVAESAVESEMPDKIKSNYASKAVNSKIGNGLTDSYEFMLSAGKNDYNSIKEKIKKAGGWTPEIKAEAKKTVDALNKKARELIETAKIQSNNLEKIASDIESI